MIHFAVRAFHIPGAQQIIDAFGLAKGGRVQRAIDSAYLDFAEEGGYVPASPDRTLEFSARLSTEIGSGLVIWNTPYARFQNAGFVMTDEYGRTWVGAGEQKPIVRRDWPLDYDKAQNPNAGAHWPERIEADHRQDIIDRARDAMKKGG